MLNIEIHAPCLQGSHEREKDAIGVYLSGVRLDVFQMVTPQVSSIEISLEKDARILNKQ